VVGQPEIRPVGQVEKFRAKLEDLQLLYAKGFEQGKITLAEARPIDDVSGLVAELPGLSDGVESLQRSDVGPPVGRAPCLGWLR